MAAGAGLPPGLAVLARDGLLSIAQSPLLPFIRPTYPGVFPQARITRIPPRFEFALPLPGEGEEVISFEERVNEIIQRWGETNEAQVREIYIALREYEQRVFTDVGTLEKRIILIVDRTLPPGDPVPPAVGERRIVSLDQMDDLFDAGNEARKKAIGQQLVLLIGSTGTGKTTVLNYLCGCEMVALPARSFAQAGSDVVIARDTVASIGHSRTSETRYPAITHPGDPTLPQGTRRPLPVEFVYCDCPGFEDTRGSEDEICNALSIVDVIQNSAGLRSTLFFCDYADLSARRIGKMQRDLQYLRMLFPLSSEPSFLNHVRFVITKFPPGLSAEDASLLLLENLIAIGGADESLRPLCQAMVTSGTQDRHILCNPLEGDRGRRVIDEILHCQELLHGAEIAPVHPLANLGHPISERAKRELDVLSRGLEDSAREGLNTLREGIAGHWNAEIARAATIAEAKANLDALAHKCAAARAALTLEHFASWDGYRIPYVLPRIDPQPKLRQGQDYWIKIQALRRQEEREEINLRLADSFARLLTTLDELRAAALEKYHTLILTEVRSRLKGILESYAIQGNVIARQGSLGDLSTTPSLVRKIEELGREAHLPIPHLDLLPAILDDREAARVIFSGMIVEHINNPLIIEGKGTPYLKATARIQKVALSQILLLCGEEICKELIVSVLFPTGDGTLYVDADLRGAKFAGKRVMITADCIKATKPVVINLSLSEWKSGICLLKGRMNSLLRFSGDNLELDVADPEWQAPLRLITKQW